MSIQKVTIARFISIIFIISIMPIINMGAVFATTQTPFAYDDFEYPGVTTTAKNIPTYLTDNGITALDGGTGWTTTSAGWKSNTTLTTNPTTAASLVTNTVNSRSSNVIKLANGDIYRGFSTPISKNTAKDYYITWTAMNSNNFSASSYFRIKFNGTSFTEFGLTGSQGTASTNEVFYPYIRIGNSGTNFIYGTTPVNWKIYNKFVLKLSIQSNGNATASLKVFDATNFEPSTYSVTATSTLTSDLSYIGLSAATSTGYFDDLRIESYDPNDANILTAKTVVEELEQNKTMQGCLSAKAIVNSLANGMSKNELMSRINAVAKYLGFVYEPANYDVSTNTAMQVSSDYCNGGFGWSTEWKGNNTLTTTPSTAAIISTLPSKSIKLTNTSIYRGLAVPIKYNVDKDYYIRWKSLASLPYSVLNARNTFSLGGKILFGASAELYDVTTNPSSLSTYIKTENMTSNLTPVLSSENQFSNISIYNYVVKISVSNTGDYTIYLKTFIDGAIEPSKWQLSASDKLTADISWIGLTGSGGSSYTNEISFETFTPNDVNLIDAEDKILSVQANITQANIDSAQNSISSFDGTVLKNILQSRLNGAQVYHIEPLEFKAGDPQVTIDVLQSGNVSCNTKVTRYYDNEEASTINNLILLMALYKGNQIVDIKTVDFANLQQGTQSENVAMNVNVPQDISDCHIKVFYWQNTTNLIPFKNFKVFDSIGLH